MIEQLLCNSISASALLALTALGIALTYRVGKFFHVGYAGLMLIGAYSAIEIRVRCNITWPGCYLVAILLPAGVGWICEHFLFSQLRRRSASALAMLLASLGLYIVLENAIGAYWGYKSELISPPMPSSVFSIADGHLTATQLINIGIACAACGVVGFLLRWTKWGLRVRAVEASRDMALAVGVPVIFTVTSTMVVGSGIAGLAGVAYASEYGAVPTMMLGPFMLGTVLCLVTERLSIRRLGIGALILGTLYHIGDATVGRHWADVLVFTGLFVYLLLGTLPRNVTAERVHKEQS